MEKAAFSLSEEDFKTLVSGKIVTLSAGENGNTTIQVSVILQDIGFGKMIEILKEVCDEKFGN